MMPLGPTLLVGFICLWLFPGCARSPMSVEPRSSSEKPLSLSPAAIKKVDSMDSGEVVFGFYGGKPWSLGVEIAKTATQRARGLMERRSLGDHEGMLFIFEEHRRHQFYMKNTYIPLDIVFFSGIRGEVEVVGILENMRPFDEEPRTVESPSWAALEIRSPLAREHGIKVGDRVVLNWASPSSTKAERKP